MKIQGPLKLVQKPHREKLKSIFIVDGPRALCKVKVDHIEGLKTHVWVQILTITI